MEGSDDFACACVCIEFRFISLHGIIGHVITRRGYCLLESYALGVC